MTLNIAVRFAPSYFRLVAEQYALKALQPFVWRWRDYSKIILVGDRGGWVLDEEVKSLGRMCRGLGYSVLGAGWERVSRRQCVFYASQFALLQPSSNNVHHECFAYFHGKPGTGVPEFDTVFENLMRTRDRWARIQVSHREFYEFLIDQGIRRECLRLIPIAVHLPWFDVVTHESRHAVRTKYGIPQSAFVVGSFQKDGNGWGEGLEPKLIKGPDLLVQAIKQASGSIKDLFVFLSGPARGYVKKGLREAGIPYRHVYERDFRRIPSLYHALDAYVVTSRQEGGPKAVLESMASGVPLVTTRVGQAADLVRTGHNGLMVDVEDVDGLVHAVESIHGWNEEKRDGVLRSARQTAEQHSWANQEGLWRDFFRGLVNVS